VEELGPSRSAIVRLSSRSAVTSLARGHALFRSCDHMVCLCSDRDLRMFQNMITLCSDRDIATRFETKQHGLKRNGMETFQL